MTHGHAHEEAEHAAHHGNDPFDRRVAMSMVVVAALLACVKVQGHRTHNDTLSYQIKAGVEQGKAAIAQSEANSAETSSANLWSFFQSKKMREVLALQDAKLLFQALSKSGSPPEKMPADLPKRKRRKEELVKELKDEKVTNAEKVADGILDKGKTRYLALVQEGYPPEKVLPIVDAQITAARYKAEGTVIRAKAEADKKKAEKAVEKGKQYLEKAEDYRKKSSHYHHQADFFDLGELGVELALVLCSVAILTKRPPFWYGGLAVGGVGLVVVLIGFFH